MQHQILRLLFVIFSLLMYSTSKADYLCINTLVQRPGGASVEIETSTSDAVLKILDTTTGNLEPLKLLFYPKSFTTWIDPKVSFWKYNKVTWTSIPAHIQKDLAIAAIKKMRLNFWENRKIPFLKVKENITLEFRKKTVFMGVEYPAGSHIIPSQKYFLNYIEFKGPENLKDFSGIEMHLRSSTLAAGDLVKSAWIFQEAIGSKRTHLHEHIVSSLPKDALSENPVHTATVITEYFRRVNLLAEVRGILRGARVTQATGPTGALDFDSLKKTDLIGVFSYLADGAKNKIQDSLKMAWVGFRGSDKYDQPGLYGFEFRTLLSDDRPELVATILNRIEHGMRNQDYGFDQNQLLRWAELKYLETSNSAVMRSAFGSLLYRQEVLNKSPEELSEVVEAIYSSPKEKEITDAIDKNDGLRMLFYDWANDPMYFEDFAGQMRVLKAQETAIKELIKKPSDDLNILARFFHSSGLVAKLENGFGVKIQ